MLDARKILLKKKGKPSSDTYDEAQDKKSSAMETKSPIKAEDLDKTDEIKKTLGKLLAQAQSSDNTPEQKAEKLSILLSSFAEFGDHKGFVYICNELLLVLKEALPNDHKALIYARILTGANQILLGRLSPKDHTYDDVEQIKEEALRQLESLIESEEKTKKADISVAQNRALVLCHLANANYSEATKNRAKNAADALVKTYNALKSRGIKNRKLLADTIWAYVLLAQAAANSKDSDMFKYARQQIREISKKKYRNFLVNPSTRDALAYRLSGTDSETYFPNWAIAIMTRAAAQFGNPLDYDPKQMDRYTQFSATADQTKQDTVKQINSKKDESVISQCDIILGNRINCKAKDIMDEKWKKAQPIIDKVAEEAATQAAIAMASGFWI